MTYQTGTATDLEDLLSQLDTFADTTHGGWVGGYTTNPQTTDGWFELSKGSLSVSMKYPVGAQGPPEHMSIHQATGFIGTGTAPGAHTADSNNGYNTGTTGHTNANLLSERCVSQIGNGPFPSYHFFADDSATHDYIHVVVEAVTGMFRHFGFGELVKFGDNWVGGEYAYGHFHQVGTTISAIDSRTQTLLDGLGGSNERDQCGTVRIASGLANQSPAVWGACLGNSNAPLNDTAGNIRRQLHASYRSGVGPRGFGNMVGNSSAGVIGLVPIEVYYRDPSNPRVQLLGHMGDVRCVNIRNFGPAETITIGADTWHLFPQSIRTTAAVNYRSEFGGIAYKQVP
tara:strand:- start:6549 stop:7574 length:1026 start_codon:yes stop_codon:yes gene_type:complete